MFVGYNRTSPTYLVYYSDTDKTKRVKCVKFFKEGSLRP